MKVSEAGLSLIEVLVAVAVFGIVSIGIYQVMQSSLLASDTSSNVVRIAEEARLGLNRLVRDTREAASLSCTPICPTATSYTINVDFDGDGVVEATNERGENEIVTYAFDVPTSTIRIQAGGADEVLIRGVTPVAGTDVFSYTSNRFDYDGLSGAPDGVVTWQEVDQAPRVGNNNGQLDSPELPYISNVGITFSVTSGNRSSQFRSQAQLRNRR